jgi:lipopolysaccharide transport protein LptA
VNALRALLSLVLLSLVCASSAQGSTKPEDVSLLVAPFEIVAPAGADLPDVDLLLADRLGTRGLGRVVGPGALSIDPVAEPTPDQLRTWAEGSRTELVVVGRATQIGRRISVDVRLRNAANGETVGTYVAEASRPEELGATVDRLAGAVVEGALTVPVLAPVSAPAPQGDAPAGSAEAGSGAEGSAAPERRQPLSIKADEMEAVEAGGGSRRFLFKRNVRLRQGDMFVRSRRMEASYPAGSSEPAKMTATGDVILRQSGRRAKCETAIFYPKEQRVVCQGNDAELEQGGTSLRGKEIEFFLDTERMVIRGGADVFMEPGDAGSQGQAQ